MRDLTHEPADVVAAERSRVATEGWGARLLALQAPDGLWAGNAFSQDWTDTFHVLELLRRFGLDPESEQARRAVGLVREHVTWRDGAWSRPAVGRPRGSSRARSSRASTATSSRPAPTSAWTWRRSSTGCSVSSSPTAAGTARSRTARRCRRSARRSTSSRACSSTSERSAARPGWPRPAGAARRTCSNAGCSAGSRPARSIDPTWLQFSFPTWWHYDVLRGLDYLRDAEVAPDDRIAEAIGVVEGNRDADGRWPLQNVHDGAADFEMDDGEGQPSRWNTLRALRVLDWFGRKD